ncbi:MULTISPECIES: hypothetical protein [Vibrio]|uniref:hypothetical protein n=1 Tax=Vibrio TaxID=662 RepID=UPI001A1A4F88|nr:MULTISPECIES: hypothetical protein [Vibrio]MCR9501937.1 hypothetical protein [Vibrio vulnificus]MCU8391472.1 hypothetical protein [Vibrio vulnificus]MCU8549306.1 hypothetical protein [Vibrio vulnificus]MCU8579813.1 hypothetical protein [Vibrio vulnificus]MDF2156124.1 hypothetical protein [Vibrio sp. CAU 1672]
MIEKSGAVFFVDILGVGALTQGSIQINKEHFEAHRFSYENKFSEHQFCAKLLLKFRRILVSATENRKNIKVAQLSDCAFLWSEDVDVVVNAAREIMWKSLLGGLMCRGGLAYGQIVEPDKVNKQLGMFICGGAVTEAVKLEGQLKGMRVAVSPEVVAEFKNIPDNIVVPKTNPIDCSVFDELLWFVYPNEITNRYSSSHKPEKEVALSILKLLAILKHSPKLAWNVSSHPGKVQVAATIDVISEQLVNLYPSLDFRFTAEYAIQALGNRGNNKYESVMKLYKSEVNRYL